MNSIISTVFENRCPQDSFIFLAFRIMKIDMPKIDRLNMYIVYYWILQVHSISCIIEMCSCLATVPTSLICCKARLVTKDFNFVCLHIIYKTIIVTTNEIITVTNRKINKEFFYQNLNHYYAFFQVKNFLFMLKLVNKVC